MTTLFIIDMQNDFMDQFHSATLPVPGSNDDALRTSDMVAMNGQSIHRVVCTMDQHPPNHIAHAIMWIDEHGRHPSPFTTISDPDVQAGRWTASLPENILIQQEYVKQVEVTIWPEHCLIGTEGAIIHQYLMNDLLSWSHHDEKRILRIFPKSYNWSTEQYSSFQAIVPREDDPSTQFNERLYEEILDDEILIAGEALSHCVAATVRDAIRHRPSDNLAARMTLLRDCTSPVRGCDAMGEEFIEEFIAAGGRVANSTEIFPSG
jgi:nicotinamidase/pyrazinamidase